MTPLREDGREGASLAAKRMTGLTHKAERVVQRWNHSRWQLDIALTAVTAVLLLISTSEVLLALLGPYARHMATHRNRCGHPLAECVCASQLLALPVMLVWRRWYIRRGRDVLVVALRVLPRMLLLAWMMRQTTHHLLHVPSLLKQPGCLPLDGPGLLAMGALSYPVRLSLHLPLSVAELALEGGVLFLQNPARKGLLRLLLWELATGALAPGSVLAAVGLCMSRAHAVSQRAKHKAAEVMAHRRARHSEAAHAGHVAGGEHRQRQQRRQQEPPRQREQDQQQHADRDRQQALQVPRPRSEGPRSEGSDEIVAPLAGGPVRSSGRFSVELYRPPRRSSFERYNSTALVAAALVDATADAAQASAQAGGACSPAMVASPFTLPDPVVALLERQGQQHGRWQAQGQAGAQAVPVVNAAQPAMPPPGQQQDQAVAGPSQPGRLRRAATAAPGGLPPPAYAAGARTNSTSSGSNGSSDKSAQHQHHQQQQEAQQRLRPIQPPQPLQLLGEEALPPAPMSPSPPPTPQQQQQLQANQMREWTRPVVPYQGRSALAAQQAQQAGRPMSYEGLTRSIVVDVQGPALHEAPPHVTPELFTALLTQRAQQSVAEAVAAARLPVHITGVSGLSMQGHAHVLVVALRLTPHAPPVPHPAAAGRAPGGSVASLGLSGGNGGNGRSASSSMGSLGGSAYISGRRSSGADTSTASGRQCSGDSGSSGESGSRGRLASMSDMSGSDTTGSTEASVASSQGVSSVEGVLRAAAAAGMGLAVTDLYNAPGAAPVPMQAV